MQHILQIAFDFDDEKVRAIATDGLEEEVKKVINGIVLDHIAPEITTYYGSKKGRDWKHLDDLLSGDLRALIDEHKEEIIERVVKKVADSVTRTKTAREALKKV